MGSSSKGLDCEETPHVLAVDDSLVDRKLIEKLFTNSQCKVTTVGNGQGALEILGLGDAQHYKSKENALILLYWEFKHALIPVCWEFSGSNRYHFVGNVDLKVNLIITDYSMPGMTGYELLKKIKGSPTMKEIPVVVVSSENIPTRINKCLEEGAQEFILKPLRQSDVKKLSCHMMKVSKSCGGRLCMGR